MGARGSSACGCPANGRGKTVIFATLCALLVGRGRSPIILVARDELVEQTVKKLRDANPRMSIGIIRGKDNELRGHVTVASVQTLSRTRRLHQVPIDRWDVVIADECHWSASDSWQRVMSYAGVNDPDRSTVSVGFTATLTRTDKRGLGDIWDEVCYLRDTRWAIEQGYLVPVTAQTVMIPDLHLEEVKVRNGDLADGDLGRAMAQAKAGPLIAAAYSEMARNEKGELRRGICFTPSIALAESFLLDFRAAGIPTELVIGSTPREERQAKYRATERGDNKVLMSVGVLTTGFDCPPVEVCVMARPTKSPGLWIQCVGRSLRPSPATGKTSALILDVVGASSMGLASIVDLELSDPEEDSPVLLDELSEDGAKRIPGVLPDAPDQVSWVPVDPFNGLVKSKPKQKRRSGWGQTDRGTFFLHTSTSFTHLVFLWPEKDGRWTVGVKPKQGNASKVATHDTFAVAVKEAEALHPRGGRPPAPLVGPATPGQLRVMEQYGVPVYDGITKQAASEALNILFASRALD